VVTANLAFIAVYGGVGEFPTLAEVMADYGYTFVPAKFVKAMCAVLMTAVVCFYMAALWPSRRRLHIYTVLVAPVAGASILASFWLVAAKHREIGLSMALIAAGAALSVAMFVRVASAYPDAAFALAPRAVQPLSRRNDHGASDGPRPMDECRRHIGHQHLAAG
jgi:hypothetical protein